MGLLLLESIHKAMITQYSSVALMQLLALAVLDFSIELGDKESVDETLEESEIAPDLVSVYANLNNALDTEGGNVIVTWWERNQTANEPVTRISTDNGASFGPTLKLAANGTIGETEEPEEGE